MVMNALIMLIGSCLHVTQLATPAAAVTTFDSDYLTIDADRIYYESAGSGFPLILVSGGSGMDHRQWRAVASQLARDFSVISYDPRGIGRSDNPTVAYSDREDLTRLLDHLGLARVGLVGLSSAGGAALEYAAANPQRISGVVASAPFIPGFVFSQPMRARLNAFNRAAQQGREHFLDALFADPHFFPSPLQPPIRTTARKVMGENFDKGAGFNSSLQLPLDPPLIDRLESIAVPILLLVGKLDHPEIHRRNQFLADAIKTSTSRVIPGAGHNPPMENANGFLAAAREFLEQLE